MDMNKTLSSNKKIIQFKKKSTSLMLLPAIENFNSQTAIIEGK